MVGEDSELLPSKEPGIDRLEEEEGVEEATAGLEIGETPTGCPKEGRVEGIEG